MHRTLTEDEWETEGIRLFGTDRRDWRFQCPTCGATRSLRETLREYPRLDGRGWNPMSECLGRYVQNITCKTAAYGFFKGPWLVRTTQGQEIPAFAFATPDETS